MKKNSNSLKQGEAQAKRRKLGVVVEREPKEVIAELVARLAGQLDVKIVPATEGEKGERDALRPNLDRLTVGVDLGDQWSNYCILGLGGETLAEGLEDYAHDRQMQNRRPEGEHVLPRVHRVISLLKRWLMGTHQGSISHEQLNHYLDEFTFRFNRRKFA